MTDFTFEQLPKAVSQLYEKLNNIERLLTEKGNIHHSESDQLLTIKEAAQVLHLSVPTIYGYVSRNEIPFSKKGKRLYFSKSELIEWIKKGRKKTLAELEASVSESLRIKNV